MKKFSISTPTPLDKDFSLAEISAETGLPQSSLWNVIGDFPTRQVEGGGMHSITLYEFFEGVEKTRYATRVHDNKAKWCNVAIQQLRLTMDTPPLANEWANIIQDMGFGLRFTDEGVDVLGKPPRRHDEYELPFYSWLHIHPAHCTQLINGRRCGNQTINVVTWPRCVKNVSMKPVCETCKEWLGDDVFGLFECPGYWR